MRPPMRWCRADFGDRIGFGRIEADEVIEVAGSPFAEFRETGRRLPLSAVRLEVPVRPAAFFCAGLNYRQHALAVAKSRGQEPVLPKRPHINLRSPTALIARGEDIVIPRDAGPAIHYEAELVAVFGRRARNVSADEAPDCIFGWTIGNDVSERNWQRQDATNWRAKNADTFSPVGPWIDRDPDLEAMRTTVRLNGRVTSSFATAEMIFDAAIYIEDLTRYVTVWPGDMLWLGTEGESEDMTPGDVVEIEISGIGRLRNRIVREASNRGRREGT